MSPPRLRRARVGTPVHGVHGGNGHLLHRLSPTIAARSVARGVPAVVDPSVGAEVAVGHGDQCVQVLDVLGFAVALACFAWSSVMFGLEVVEHVGNLLQRVGPWRGWANFSMKFLLDDLLGALDATRE
eukprot:8548007-Pyramimonas_sp.AAC.1